MILIAEELMQIRDTYAEKNTLKETFHFDGTSLLPWHIILACFLCTTALLVHSILDLSYSDLTLGFVVVILCLVGFNLFLAFWNQVQKKKEVIQRISWLSDIIKVSCKNKSLESIIQEFLSCMKRCQATSYFSGASHFSLLYLPHEDNPVPFPTSLVASGCVIGLCCGQPSPCHAVCSLDRCITLLKGDTFSKDDLGEVHYTEEHKDHLYKFDVVRSPIVEDIELSLNDSSNSGTARLFNRPRSMLAKKREDVFRYLTIFIIPVLLGCSVVISFIWYFLPCYHPVAKEGANSSFSASLLVERNNDKYWFELFVTTPVLAILPLIPILCPMLWIGLYLLGEAKTLAPIFETKSKRDIESKDLASPTPTPTYSLDELLSENPSTEAKPITWVQLLPKVLFGDPRLFSQNAGTFDALGSLTALCCIDKEGVLSWYDPAPEKVCFFTQMAEWTKQDADGEEYVEESEDFDATSNSSSASPTPAMESFTGKASDDHMEIITLSQDSQRSNKFHFDDPDWSRFLPSLKAIGLNILATNLVEAPEESNAFRPLYHDCQHGHSHNLMSNLKEVYRSSGGDKNWKSCQEALMRHQDELKFRAYELGCPLPEISCLKTGLRGLAELTGFESDASLLHMPKMVLTSYKKGVFLKQSINKRFQRHLSPPASEGLCTTSTMGYLHGVVVSRWPDQTQDHLMVSGTGDLVVQGCTHYWDGADVKFMSDTNRRRVLDFCHRHVITGSCIAFSFRPVGSAFKSKGNHIKHALEDSDDEFPPEQIFLGAVAMQYQARINVFHLIEALDHASIRFVHFSSEDEFKARVFAEKMGLEVGWNCHISLSSREQETGEPTSHSLDDSDTDGQEDDDPSSSLLNHQFPQTPISESSFSDSAFHALNRAKLPRGIENIIPHIENIDNVPLLVPLFTDCRQNSTIKMIEIMQKYNEVVCCIGSSDHIDNIPVFAKADVSIGLQPLLTSSDHVSRGKASSFRESPRMDSSLQISGEMSQGSVHKSTKDSDKKQLDNTLMSLARTLNIFPCSVALSSDDSLAVLYEMIKQARHILFLTHVSLVFYMKCLFMISFIQLLTHILHLPLIFTPLDVFWLSYVIVPFLSFSILASPRDSDLMKWASITNTSRLIKDNLKHFVTKFAPSCVIVVALYALGLQSSCQTLQENFTPPAGNVSTKRNDSNDPLNHTNVQCYPCFTMDTNSTNFPPQESALSYIAQQKRIAQQLCICAMVLYTCIISSAYVHRWKLFIKHPPFSNKVWITTVLAVFLVQAIYSTVTVFSGRVSAGKVSDGLLGPYEPLIWIILFLWPLLLFVFNEFAKYKEIRMWTRSQKRARLAFGTKLGMNSPF